jgi:hypothetical protein
VVADTPSLEELSQDLYVRLTRPERALARMAFSQEMKQSPRHDGTHLRRTARQAYTSAFRSLLGLASILLVGGVALIIAGQDNHVPVVEPVGIALVVVWAVIGALIMIRAVQVTRYCNRNLGGYSRPNRRHKRAP